MAEREFGTKLYYQLSLDGLVPQDQRLCRIARAVDFAFVRRLCRPFYSHTGQPSVDPVVIFKMLLIGYLYGITSERRMAKQRPTVSQEPQTLNINKRARILWIGQRTII